MRESDGEKARFWFFEPTRCVVEDEAKEVKKRIKLSTQPHFFSGDGSPVSTFQSKSEKTKNKTRNYDSKHASTSASSSWSDADSGVYHRGGRRGKTEGWE